MKAFVIERDIPGASLLTAAELKGIATKSCEVSTRRFAAAIVQHAAAVLNELQQRYHAARQRRALARLSMPELKDLGYPTVESSRDRTPSR